MTTATLYLERLGALLQQSLREDAARHGLLPIHLQVLQYLAQANRYSDLPIAIADYFGITRGTVSQTLTVLERKALVVKQADARHGKRIHLKLTPAGMAVLQNSWAERVQGALDMHADGAALADTLRSLLVALQRLNGQHAFGICRQCAHFRTDGDTTHCGLTGEALAIEQTGKICREWATPA
ncbi:MarR family winged helix-turn-helix transcriptional regulator [Thauera butanivorans]|uniref:MarR family winged helix-turn-helix transcriptional regulator n=1 Tax=Thauera butanivorans TaxID=86174 RepID=UPI00083923D4|nr:MarR family transcriptional regulator [Thauera butanivorans]